MSISEDSAPRKPRITDTTAADARRAVATIAEQCGPFRARIAVISVRARRRLRSVDREALVIECGAIAKELAEARTELMSRLIDQPQRVLSHSRVTDIEKSLDNLEISLTEARNALDIRDN